MGPASTVREEDGDALTLGKRGERCPQPGFEPRFVVGGLLVENAGLATASPALPDPVEVAGDVLHTSELVPVFPRVCEGFSNSLASALVAIRRNECTSKTWFCLGHE